MSFAVSFPIVSFPSDGRTISSTIPTEEIFFASSICIGIKSSSSESILIKSSFGILLFEDINFSFGIFIVKITGSSVACVGIPFNWIVKNGHLIPETISETVAVTPSGILGNHSVTSSFSFKLFQSYVLFIAISKDFSLLISLYWTNLNPNWFVSSTITKSAPYVEGIYKLIGRVSYISSGLSGSSFVFGNVTWTLAKPPFT